VLVVGTAIGKISIGDTLRTIWNIAVLVVLLIVALVPSLSLWLPTLRRAGA
jgi:TRAP-type C4-dicarboxylate transport system permease large subunit